MKPYIEFIGNLQKKMVLVANGQWYSSNGRRRARGPGSSTEHWAPEPGPPGGAGGAPG